MLLHAALKRSPWALALHLAMKMPHEWKGTAFMAKYFNKNKITWGLNICEGTSCINEFGYKWHSLPLRCPAHSKICSPASGDPSAVTVPLHLRTWLRLVSAHTFQPRHHHQIQKEIAHLWSSESVRFFFPPFEQSSLNSNTLIYHQTISQCTHLPQ